MKTRIKLALQMALFVAMCLTLTVCHGVPVGSNVRNAIPATATAVEKASAHVTSAQFASDAVKPHADVTGKALLGIVTNEHIEAQKSLTVAGVDLATAQKQRDLIVKQAADQAVRFKVENAALAAKYNAVYHSFGYQCELWTIRLFWLAIGLLAAHAVGALLALALPPPYGPIASIVAKVVNPAGWITAGLAFVEKNRAVAVAASAVIPTGGVPSIGTLKL